MIDAAVFAATFDQALLARGVNAGPSRAGALAEALERALPAAPAALYWFARVAMLPRIDDLTAFHAAFLDVATSLDDAEALRALVETVPAPSTERPAKRESVRRPPPPANERADRDAGSAVPYLAMASAEERLGERDFAEMTDAERAQAFAAMQRLRVASDLRRSRRRRVAARGDRLDVHATLRASARTAGELARRRYGARRMRPRPLVFLCDVSGSMTPYARALLLYARVAALARPRVRAFAFATRLTEVTGIARATRPARAMDAYASALGDYGGGTRIAGALDEFAERYARRGAARGGTIVILSDGWERERPAGVGDALRRLRRLTRRIVWVNPQKKHEAFEPLAGGMAAALPYLDAFVSGHNLRSLAAIAAAVEGGIDA